MERAWFRRDCDVDRLICCRGLVIRGPVAEDRPTRPARVRYGDAVTARIPVPPGEEDAAAEAARKKDVKNTWWGLAGVFILLLFASYVTAFNVFGQVTCQAHPATCNETMVAIGLALAPTGLWVIFGISVLVSVVMVNQGKRAHVVPIIGAIAIAGCMIISYSLISGGIR